MRKISELKATARTALQGRYGLLICSLILVSLISGAGSNLASEVFGGESVFSFAMGQVFALVVSLITSVFTAGLYYMFLKISRGERAFVGDLMYLFYHHPDRVILVVLEYVCMLPGQIYSYQANIGDSYLEILKYLSVFMLITLAGMLVAAILTIPFSFSYYLLADDMELGAAEALKESMRLMKGNYGRFIYLKVSFAGLYLLGVFSLGIGLFWVMPYAQMAEVEFYRELRGEMTKKEEKQEREEEHSYVDIGGYHAEA